MIYLYWLIGILAGAGLIWLAAFLYGQRQDMNRSLDMVFLLIRIPRKDSKEDIEKTRESFSSGNDFKEAIGLMSHFFEQLGGLADSDFAAKLKRQDFLSFEYAVQDKLINFYVVCPADLVDVIEKQITGFYPDCFLERVEDYNIFHPGSKVSVVPLKFANAAAPWKPIKTYDEMNSDPLNSIINVMSKFEDSEGAAIQIMLRPTPSDKWQNKGREEAKEIFSGKVFSVSIGICKYNGGGIMQLPHAIPDDGLFDITAIRKVSKFKVIRNLVNMYDGSFIKIKEVETFTGKDFRITGVPENSIYLETDGESLGNSPLDFKILKKKAKMVIK